MKLLKGFDFREQYILGWKGALLSAISVLIGYSLKTKFRKNITKYCDLNYKSFVAIGLILNIIGLFIFLIVTGFDFTHFLIRF